MNSKEIRSICELAIEVFGENPQIDMAEEEMDELGVALHHWKRGRGTKEEVITEIADVLITATQLGIIFGIDEVTKEMEYKLNRLVGRIVEKVADCCFESIKGTCDAEPDKPTKEYYYGG